MGQVAYLMPDNVYQDDSRKTSVRDPLDNTKEKELLQKIAKLDRDAFHQLFLLYYSKLQRFISRLTQSHELIEEIINDVMFVVWQKAGDFQDRSRVSTWIFGIAYNKALKTIAKQSRHQGESLDENSESIDPATPFSELAQQQELTQIQNSLTQLSLEHQTVVILTYIYGYSYSEISEVMACPVNTVKTRMFHARKKLNTLLPKDETVFELRGCNGN